MIDTAAITAEIARLIFTGFAEEHLRAVVAQKFPELTEQEFSAALQEATEQAENRVVTRSWHAQGANGNGEGGSTGVTERTDRPRRGGNRPAPLVVQERKRLAAAHEVKTALYRGTPLSVTNTEDARKVDVQAYAGDIVVTRSELESMTAKLRDMQRTIVGMLESLERKARVRDEPRTPAKKRR